jgi:hypothetical protein
MDEVKLDISCVTEKDGKKRAYILFTRGNDIAEGYIPECVLTKVQGFTDEEKDGLERYLKANLTELKKRAAKVNPITAMMRDEIRNRKANQHA